jgi:YfiH family protein
MDRIAHGFTTRAEDLPDLGNVGLGGGGSPDTAQTNRGLWAGAVLPDAPLVSVYQIHSANVAVVDMPWEDGARPEADALVTNKPGILLGVLGADCAPVLLADDEAGVVAAAHAGWRGALAGVTDATLDAMERLGANRLHITACIGPCIAQKNYEVDAAFMQRFLDADEANERFFVGGKNPSEPKGSASASARRAVSPNQETKHQFDLEGYIAARLSKAGLSYISCMGEDTYGQEHFFSHRRATHDGRDNEGRHMGVIGLIS